MSDSTPSRPSSQIAAAPIGPPTERYEFGKQLARGGMGVVYSAKDRALSRTVAVKVLLDGVSDRPSAAKRFVTEAKITGQLQHPGIPPVYDLGTLPDGRPFLAMKLIKGRTLDDALDARPDPKHDLPQFIHTFEQIAQTVAFAHSKGVIHRDLKPSNVMVGAFGEVQVMDWGLAKILGMKDDWGPPNHIPPEELAGTLITAGSDTDHKTRAGSVLGTLSYMPPEQARGEGDKVDRRADVFALGAILCEILTGEPPYIGGGREVYFQAVLGQVDGAFKLLDGCEADQDFKGSDKTGRHEVCALAA